MGKNQRNTIALKGNKDNILAHSEKFSGPLPHPDILSKYESIQPGAANRIIRMAERQSIHRQGLEKSVVRSNIRNENNGMIFAFAIMLTLVIAGSLLVYFDKQISGLLVLFTAVLTTAGNFYFQHKKGHGESRADNKKTKERE